MNQYLRNIILILLIGSALIYLCHNQIDKTIVSLAYQHHWNRFVFLKGLTYLAPITLIFSFLSIIYIVCKRCINTNISTTERTIFVGSINTIITSRIAESLKFVFGATWPATWINNNPSWIRNKVYGFHFFHGGVAYSAFPSGHTTIVFAMITVLWFGIPKWRWLFAVIGIGIAVGLIGMYYHFITSVIAGAMLGMLTGTLAIYAFLKNSSQKNRNDKP